MSLGDLDVVIAIDEQGRYIPQRSRSRAQLEPGRALKALGARAALARAERVEQKLGVFGPDELEQGERDALSEAALWRPEL